jgi:hypothetical protein
MVPSCRACSRCERLESPADRRNEKLDLRAPGGVPRDHGSRRVPRPEVGSSVVGKLTIVLYVAAMVIVIVGVDVLFFRDHPWARLAVNVGIVLVFGACYFRFVRRS